MNNKCILPFVRHDYWQNSPCCKIKNFDYESNLEQLINEHANNKQSKFCSTCWKFEKENVWSKRQESNRHFENLGIDVATTKKRKIRSLVISTGNVCNLSCVYCSSFYSSTWKPKQGYMEKNKIKGKSKTFNLIPTDSLEQIIWNDIVDIEFQGGETLMSKNLWNVIDLANPNTSISLLSNGTVKLKEEQIQQIQKFKKLYITLSIDGVEKVFEYCRRPAIWQDVKNNIQEYKKIIGLNRLSLQVTVSSLNVFYIDRMLLELAKILPATSNINIVTAPQTMAPATLTPSIGSVIEKKNPLFFKNRKIEWKGNDATMKNFLNYIHLQDEFDKMKMEEYLPEFFELIKLQFPHH